MATEGEKRKVQSIERGYEILEYLRKNGPSTIADIESTVGLSAGSIHTYLTTLKEIGFVGQEGTKYHLGLMFIPYGVYVRNETELFSSSKNIIMDLAHEVDGSVHLMTEYKNRILVLEEVYVKDTPGYEMHIKKRGQLHRHLHCTAGGKAILSQLPEAEVHDILDDHGLPSRTSQTITDREELFEELAAAREQGYVLNDQEHMPGLRAIGVPICRDDNEVVLGAISISGSAANWTEKRFTEDLPRKVKEYANEIEIVIHSENRI